MITRTLSPASFGLAILCFLAPFCTLSCEGRELGSVSGIKLATGTTIETESIVGPPSSQRIPPEKLVGIAFATAVLGLVIGLFASDQLVLLAFLGGSGAITLLMEITRTKPSSNALLPQFVEIHIEPAFWVAVLLLASACVINLFVYIQDSTTQSSPPTST